MACSYAPIIRCMWPCSMTTGSDKPTSAVSLSTSAAPASLVACPLLGRPLWLPLLSGYHFGGWLPRIFTRSGCTNRNHPRAVGCAAVIRHHLLHRLVLRGYSATGPRSWCVAAVALPSTSIRSVTITRSMVRRWCATQRLYLPANVCSTVVNCCTSPTCPHTTMMRQNSDKHRNWSSRVKHRRMARSPSATPLSKLLTTSWSLSATSDSYTATYTSVLL